MTGLNSIEQNTNEQEYKFDYLKMYSGLPYIIQKDEISLKINQPKVGEIINAGEKVFYSTLYKFVGNTTMFRLNLWKVGVDWNKISDYELFCSVLSSCDPQIVEMLFGNKSLISYELIEIQKKDDSKPLRVLYNSEVDMVITEETYFEIREYLRAMFNIYPKVEFARNKITKEAIIEDDETRIKIANDIGEDNDSSTLLPLISFAINHPGFKYNLSQTLELGICQFMDSIQRLQVYESTRALYGGMYSGFCDISKQLQADPDLLNFAKDLSNKSSKNNTNNKSNNETSN